MVIKRGYLRENQVRRPGIDRKLVQYAGKREEEKTKMQNNNTQESKAEAKNESKQSNEENVCVCETRKGASYAPFVAS